MLAPVVEMPLHQHDTRKCREGRSVYLRRRIHGLRQWWQRDIYCWIGINKLACPCSPTFSSVDHFGNRGAAAWIFLEVGHSCEFLNKSHEIFRISVYSFWGVCVDDHLLTMLSCCGGGNGWRRCFFFFMMRESLLSFTILTPVQGLSLCSFFGWWSSNVERI